MNKVILIGRLGSDPELKHTQTGQACLTLRLATSERWKDKAGERQERTEWHTVTLWGPRAEPLHRLLTKGEMVCVEGSIRTRSWEKDGQKRYATEINATEVHLLGGRKDGGGQRPQRERRPADDMPDDIEGEDPIPF